MERPALTERRKHETRKDIAVAAMELFARDGYDEVGAEEISAHAGVSLRTFYRYFSGKDTVLSPIISAGTGVFAEAIAARPAEESLAVAVQRAYSEISADIGPERVHSVIGLVVTVPVLRARWLDDLRAIEDRIVEVILERDRNLTEDQGRLTAAAIVVALRLTLERRARTGGSEPLAEALGEALDYLGGGARLAVAPGAEPTGG
jgi:AcrR family transcriptional regulator